MYSNIAKSQDLYFTNPMDHFLGSESQKRTNAESGFSSGFPYNQSGSSKDVFSFPNSTDIFSQKSKEQSDTPVCGKGTKFQNYISQNLILGSLKNTPGSVLSNRSKCDYNDIFSSSTKTFPEASSDETNCKIIKEIRNVGETIQKSSQKSESYMLSLKDIMEEVRMVKESQAKLLKMTGENHERYEKKIELLSSKISECLNQVKEQAGKYDEMYDVQQSFCKKLFRDAENERKYFERNVKNMVTEMCCEIHKSVRDLNNNFEETLDEKLCALRSSVSLSNEKKMRNDKYLQRKSLFSRQNIENVNNLSGFLSTNYTSSKPKPKFEDDYRYNKYGSNSEKYFMNSSNHLGEHARKMSCNGITSEESSPTLHEMFGNKSHQPSSYDSFNFGTILNKNLTDKYLKLTNRGQNASFLDVANVSLPKSQAKNGKKKSFTATPGVSNSDEMEYKGKLRSSKGKSLTTKKAAAPPKKRTKTAPKNRRQKKSQDTTPQNQNARGKSSRTVNTPVVRKSKPNNKTVRATGNTGITNCSLFSASYCSSPGINIFEAVNMQKKFQYFA